MNALRPPRPSWTAAIVQLTMAVGVIGGAIAAPPARGAMLLTPLDGRPHGASVRLALAHGGLLIGRGPVPGSIIVTGERARLVAPLLAQGLLVTAAPARWCGA